MADKHEFGSPESVGEYIGQETSKKHLWFAFAILEAAILLWNGYLLGANGGRVTSIIGVVAAAVALVLSVINYGTAREKILFGKIILSDGIFIKTDAEGNVVATTNIENIIEEREEDEHGR